MMEVHGETEIYHQMVREKKEREREREETEDSEDCQCDVVCDKR